MAQIYYLDGVRATPENWQRRVNELLAKADRRPHELQPGETVTYYSPDPIIPIPDPDKFPWPELAEEVTK